MKKDINPVYGIVAVVCVVLIAVYYLYHASVDKPMYPGYMAPKPGMHAGMTQAEAAKMHIPGVTVPKVGNGPPQQNGMPAAPSGQ